MNGRELLEEWVEAFNAGDVERFVALYAKDCEYRLPAFGIEAHGREQMAAVVRSFLDALPDRTITPIRTEEDAGRVVLVYRYEGTSSGRAAGLPPAGERFTSEIRAELTLREGEIERHVDHVT